MPGVSYQKNMGAYMTATSSPAPANDAGGSTNGASYDVADKSSGKLVLAAGAASGTPTTQTADAKLQDSADGSSWADVAASVLPVSAVAQLSADDTQSEVDLNLTRVRQYVRVVVDVAFTGGTSPAWPVHAYLLLGGDDNIPAS